MHDEDQKSIAGSFSVQAWRQGVLDTECDAVFACRKGQLLLANAPALRLMREHAQQLMAHVLGCATGQGSLLNLQGQVVHITVQEANWLDETVRLAVARELLAPEARAWREGAVSDLEAPHPAQHGDRLEILLMIASEGFWDWYIPEGVVYFSPRWIEMLGYGPNEMRPSFSAWVDLIHPEDLGGFLDIWASFMEGSRQTFMAEYRILDKAGNWIWVEARGIRQTDGHGNPVRLAGTHVDITERKLAQLAVLESQQKLEILVAERTQQLEAANRHLEHLTRIDPLTRLSNRRHLLDTLASETSRARREKTCFSVLMLDIDYFKAYNDAHGHAAGDTCIQAVAEILRRALKRSADLAARYGGEEFIVLLPATDLDGALRVAEDIMLGMRGLQALPLNPNTGQPVTLSIGVASARGEELSDGQALVRSADAALYDAKSGGRDRICSGVGCHAVTRDDGHK